MKKRCPYCNKEIEVEAIDRKRRTFGARLKFIDVELRKT